MSFEFPLDEIDVPFPPSTWTADWVMYLMVLAAEIVGRERHSVGPRGFAVAWPQHTYTDDEVAGWNSRSQIEGEALTPGQDRRFNSASNAVTYTLPDKDEVWLASQVLYWPVKYLGGDDVGGVAITRWASGRARGHAGSRGIVMVEAEAQKISQGLHRDRVLVFDVPMRLRDQRDSVRADFEPRYFD
jgi:hypothetical protein